MNSKANGVDADMALRRVVVTGMGVVTALGISVPEMWQALLAGRSGVRHIQQFTSDDFPVRIGSEVEISRLGEPDVSPELIPFMSRTVRFGTYALDQAWRQAGLHEVDVDPWRAGICIGAYNFPVLVGDQIVAPPASILEGDHYHPGHYLAFCRTMPSILAQRDIGMVSTLMAMDYPLYGPSVTIQTACASSTQAVGESLQMIRHGEADLMVTGGADSLLSAICISGFTLLGVASAYQGDPTKACRPFDFRRDGLVMGEGAGILILEELEHARRRNAAIYGEIMGYGSSCDGYRFTDSHPEGRGPIRAMHGALRDAGIAPQQVDYVNAHGTATRQNDSTETLALKKVFGDYAFRLPVSSTKSQLGHLICAAGGVELVVTIQALIHGILPPTINLEYPDPACDLDYVPNEPRPGDIRTALSNSFGFGGQNGSLIVRRWEE